MDVLNRKSGFNLRNIPLCGVLSAKPEELLSAIQSGVRLINISPMGLEKADGDLISNCLKKCSVKRDRVFIMLNCTFNRDESCVERTVRDALEKCGLDYFDNCSLSWRYDNEKSTKEFAKMCAVWKAMEKLVDTNLVLSLGVSNFGASALTNLFDYCHKKPVTNAVEMHPYLSHGGDDDLHEFCELNDVHLLAYSPFGGSALNSPTQLCILDDPHILKISEASGHTPAETTLRWILSKGCTVLLESAHNIKYSLFCELFDWRLRRTDIKAIDRLDQNHAFEGKCYEYKPSDCKFVSRPNSGASLASSPSSLAMIVEINDKSNEDSSLDYTDEDESIERPRGMSNPATYYPKKNVVVNDDGTYSLSTDVDGLKRSTSSMVFDVDDDTVHPDLDNQLLFKAGVLDKTGVYHNYFSRDGKTMQTHIYMSKGIMENIDQHIMRILPTNSHSYKNYIVTDEIVDKALDLDAFVTKCKAVGLDIHKIAVQAEQSDESGETSTEPYKTMDVFNDTIEEILANKISKHSCIISVGGGVINNLAGVIAGTLYRGIGLVHFTTTSMGMLDAALDFKQAINHDMGKNLLGCYYPASCVVIDPVVLKSLSVRHIRNGIGEALKHGLCQSKSMVDAIVGPVLATGIDSFKDVDYVVDVCKMCIEIKTPTLDCYHNSDFNEMCPQYGHAVAHAIESLSWYAGNEALLHGEAVAIGMCVSAEISLLRGYCDEDVVKAHYNACEALGLPSVVPATMNLQKIIQKLYYDKHFTKKPSMGLVDKIGSMASFDNGESRSYTFEIEIEELEQGINLNRSRQFCQACN